MRPLQHGEMSRRCESSRAKWAPTQFRRIRKQLLGGRVTCRRSLEDKEKVNWEETRIGGDHYLTGEVSSKARIVRGKKFHTHDTLRTRLPILWQEPGKVYKLVEVVSCEARSWSFHLVHWDIRSWSLELTRKKCSYPKASMLWRSPD